MPIDENQLHEQMQRARFRNGRFERLQDGCWVEWPVLTIDRLGQKAADRAVQANTPRDR